MMRIVLCKKPPTEVGQTILVANSRLGWAEEGRKDRWIVRAISTSRGPFTQYLLDKEDGRYTGTWSGWEPDYYRTEREVPDE